MLRLPARLKAELVISQTQLDRARPHLVAAIDRTPIDTSEKPTIAEVEARLLDGEARLWLGQNSAAVTEPLRELNCGSVYRATLAGGNLQDLMVMLREAEYLARALGFEHMVVDDGRPGWTRALGNFGYQPVRRLIKEL